MFALAKQAGSFMLSKARGDIQQNVDPLIDGLIEGTESLTDLVIGLFPVLLIVGLLSLVIGYISWKRN